MNKYFIYNNQEIFFFYCNTLDEAKQKAIMLSDHSKEIIEAPKVLDNAPRFETNPQIIRQNPKMSNNTD